MATTVMTPSPSAQEISNSHIESNLSSSGNSSNGIKFVPYDKSLSQKTELEECKNKFRQFRMKNRDNQTGGNDANSGRANQGANTRTYSQKSDGNVKDWQGNSQSYGQNHGQNHGQNYGQNYVQNHSQNHVQNHGQNQVRNSGQNHRHNHGQNDGQNQVQPGNPQRYRHAAGNGHSSQRSNHGREAYGNTRDNYGRRNSGSGSIKGRNLPPRLQRQRSATGGVDHETTRKTSQGEHHSGGHSRVENNSSRRENSRRDNSKRHHAPRNEYARPNAHYSNGNSMNPPFSFDPRLPFPNPITGMFSPASLDDSWMDTPMNQIFDGYNHHKHGQQWSMKDFVKDGQGKLDKEQADKTRKSAEKQKSVSQNDVVRNPQEPMFSMEQMQQFYVGWSYMMQQQQNMQAMQNMQNMYAMQQQMASSKGREKMAQKDQLAKKHNKSVLKASLPPPGFSTNDRDSPNLSDVTRSSNSTLPSELNECAVQEAMSSTAKKPINMVSSLNYARNPHPNSPYHRKTANIPNPFLNQSNKPCNDQSVLDLCLEKHVRYPVEKRKVQEKMQDKIRKDDQCGVTFDTGRNKVLYEEKNLFADKSMLEEKHFKSFNISDPNYSFNDASFHNNNGFNNASSLTNASDLNPTSSFNNASNNNSSFVQNSSLATNSNLFGSSSIFNKSNDASGNKSAFSNELRTSGYVTNDTSKHSTTNLLLSESEPALKIGDEFKKYSRGAREQSNPSAEENLRGILLPGLRQSLGKSECLGDRWQQESVHQAYMQSMPQDH